MAPRTPSTLISDTLRWGSKMKNSDMTFLSGEALFPEDLP